ncbi:unnamed protein product [Meganyctiphanes norvegica]|uniref:Uncharacterized protein n=1 Tax=Meganyctiphanes norvegica TaxID=48144 RepID=A0AAV2RS14_MEGNR
MRSTAKTPFAACAIRDPKGWLCSVTSAPHRIMKCLLVLVVVAVVAAAVAEPQTRGRTSSGNRPSSSAVSPTPSKLRKRDGWGDWSGENFWPMMYWGNNRRNFGGSGYGNSGFGNSGFGNAGGFGGRFGSRSYSGSWGGNWPMFGGWSGEFFDRSGVAAPASAHRRSASSTIPSGRRTQG